MEQQRRQRYHYSEDSAFSYTSRLCKPSCIIVQDHAAGPSLPVSNGEEKSKSAMRRADEKDLAEWQLLMRTKIQLSRMSTLPFRIRCRDAVASIVMTCCMK